MTAAAVAETAEPQSTRPVTVPGVYDMPAAVYHRDPVPGGSLSSSGSKRLLPPSCPALFWHWTTHGQAPKAEFDFGHAAHMLVLGAGPELAIVDADNWRTKAAQAARDEAREAGAVPLLRADYERVQAMAMALGAHPFASQLFEPGKGLPEQALFWQDQPTGVWRRAMLDWLPEQTSRRLIVPDYKTTVCAAPEHITRALHQFAYHQQAAWYLDGVRALGLADGDAAFVFVFQEKTAPYLVTVVEPNTLALQVGRERNRRAIDLYAQCVASGRWPGYSDQVELVGLPAWAEREFEAGAW